MSDRFSIRASLPEDLTAIISLTDDAFGQPDEGRIVDCLHEDGESLLSLVAVIDGNIAGHIQFFSIDTISATPARFAGLGPMSVTSGLQKTGIDSALIQAGLEKLKADGIQRVFVLGHKDYYPKFGFSVSETAGMSAPWGGPYFMAIVLNAGGPDMAGLQYPAAFFED